MTPNASIITSPANPRLKQLAALRKRRERDQRAETLVEGFDELRLAVAAGATVSTLCWCPELYPDRRTDRAAFVEGLLASGVPGLQLSRAAFEKVAYREGPDGILGVAPAPDRSLAQLQSLLSDPPLLLVAEGVEKPGNLGAMVRTADAAGVDGILAADPVGDWANPNVVRASKGAVFAVPVASTPTTAALDWLDEREIAVIATTPDTNLSYTDIDLTGPIAIAVGTEQTGLTNHVLRRATHRVRIPMVGRADSLNVATSAAIVLFEAVRQRTGARSVGGGRGRVERV